MLKFYNTLTDRVEPFEPLEPGRVRMYCCGPTVWNMAHIGNFRTFVFEDVLRRYLEFKNFQVKHIINLTDVDDRIIAESIAAKQTLDEYTAKYIAAFWEDFDALGCLRPEIAPRATRHIDEMAALIHKLIDSGHAYRSDGSVYYRIASFPEYGKLSKINFAGNIAGASERVDTDKYDKEDARDFALWKAVEAPGEPSWVTEIGSGRPGWHIECSAMSMKYLGETFDLHAGGIDLVFPHHENEIAQSEGATGKPFARYWIHGEHLKVEGETMSKSKGNYYTFRDLVEMGYTAAAIRYLLLSVPYRNQLNFTFDTMRGAETTVARLRDFRARLSTGHHDTGNNEALHDITEKALRDFEEAMDDNLNTSVALAALHNLMREVNTALSGGCRVRRDNQQEVLGALARLDTVLNIFGDERTELLDDAITELIDQRQEARRRRDFARADEIRQELLAHGIVLEDTKDGVRWKRRAVESTV